MTGYRDVPGLGCMDDSAPTLRLRGPATMTMKQCDKYVESGVEVVDANSENDDRCDVPIDGVKSLEPVRRFLLLVSFCFCRVLGLAEPNVSPLFVFAARSMPSKAMEERVAPLPTFGRRRDRFSRMRPLLASRPLARP